MSVKHGVYCKLGCVKGQAMGLGFLCALKGSLSTDRLAAISFELFSFFPPRMRAVGKSRNLGDLWIGAVKDLSLSTGGILICESRVEY